MPHERIISADSHIIEPPTLWSEHLDKRFRERAPRVRREMFHGTECEMWSVEGMGSLPVGGFLAASASGEDAVFRIAAKQRVLSLQRGDRVDLRGPAQSIRCRFAEADVADLAFLNECGHGSDGFLDRSRGIDAMLVVEIDGLDAEPLQAAFASRPYVFGLAADTTVHRIREITDDAEFGRDLELMPMMLDSLADQDLVRVRAIHIGGVKKRDAQFERAMDSRDGLLLVARSVEFRHPHTAESHGGDFEGA